MSRADPVFSDLAVRLTTGVALAVAGFGAIWAGGWAFLALTALAVGVMHWELGRLGGLSSTNVVIVAPAAALSIAGALLVAGGAASVAFLALPALLSLGVAATVQPDARASIPVLVAGSLAIMLAGYVALILRDGGGVIWMLWLILSVVVTDICGYFAGRLIGGPKFWPRVSPKKTWSGIVAGWIGAGIVGALFMAPTGTREGLIAVSVLVSMASQLGDISESALKRRAGVKDSSRLLPGHGGLLDRLDGVLGATLILGLVALVTNYPEAPI
ncbi:phosphatidate cytidylyltransferase [Rhodobacterales bacterium HKCCE3408]|nr:phosphatidate cytidylyltransferase [Rhodobacterales bacterium HKCCE3408]